MGQRALGLTWLDRNDQKQQEWANKYLQGKGEIGQQRHPLRNDQLLRIGEELESTREGILLIGQMKDAWRKFKSNASDNEKGRKTYAFKLKVDVKNQLAWLAKKKKVTAAEMLGRLISGELDAHVRFETTLNEEKKTHKELLRNSKNNTAQYKETNKTLRELLDVSIARVCRLEILLQDVAPSTEPVTQDQQRRIDKRCKQIMVDAEAIVKGQSTLLPSELFNHSIPVGDSTQALKEPATESPFCSQKSPTENQSSSTEYTSRIDSERLPLPEEHLESTFVLVAAPHDPATNNLAGLRPKELPEEKNSVSLEKNANDLESRSVLQSRPGSEALTDISAGIKKIPLQIKKTTVLRVSQGKSEEN